MLKAKNRKLTGSEKRQIKAVIRRTRSGHGNRVSAQQTIPYQRMYPDGVCRVDVNRYNKTIQFQDINYQLSENEDKDAIFGSWCEFINYFDSSVSFEFSFLNLENGQSGEDDRIEMTARQDDFDGIREEYAQMLQNQLARGNNGLRKTKYLTFTIEADSVRNAKPRLERIEAELLGNFKRMGVHAQALDGKARLALLHGIFHMDTKEPFAFDWDWLAPSGLSTRDFIAPASFEFPDGRTFRIGEKFCSASFLQITAADLSDRALEAFLAVDSSLIVSMHIRAIDQTEAVKMVKRKITELDRTKIEEQKRAVRSGYDMDILPSDLTTLDAGAKDMLKSLQNHNERMLMLTFILVNAADTKRKLKADVQQCRSIAQTMNCSLVTLDFQQERAMQAALPLGVNPIRIERGLTTSALGIFIPFTTQELFQKSEGALYYGVNSLSHNMILVDRKLLSNPNGLILGTPGSGKSFAAKREMVNVFLVTDDDIIICDPEAEYAPLVRRLHGQIIRISPVGSDYINPLDINMNYADEEDPVTLKSDFVLSMCELIVGGKEGLQPIEKTVIDRCVRSVYQAYFADPKPETMPILEDLYVELKIQPEPEAQRIATALEIYVHGSLNLFNHRTNVNLKNRLVCYDIKGLGKQLKKLGMLIVQDQVWNRVTINRAQKKSTRYYMDEFHLLLKEPQTAAYSVEIWKRFRKWGGIPTAITQNLKDLLASAEIENIFENSDFILMLNQAPGDREILAKKLGISARQLSYVKQSGAGEGLLLYGDTILPFVDRFPQNTELYRLMTTRLNETAGQEEKNG